MESYESLLKLIFFKLLLRDLVFELIKSHDNVFKVQNIISFLNKQLTAWGKMFESMSNEINDPLLQSNYITQQLKRNPPPPSSHQ